MKSFFVRVGFRVAGGRISKKHAGSDRKKRNPNLWVSEKRNFFENIIIIFPVTPRNLYFDHKRKKENKIISSADFYLSGVFLMTFGIRSDIFRAFRLNGKSTLFSSISFFNF